MMANKNEKNETLKKPEIPYPEYSRDLTPSAGRVKEAGETTDQELGDMGKIYGVKETLKYAQGLDMENAGNAGLNTEYSGELNGDQTNDLQEIGDQPQCSCECGDLDQKDKLPSEKNSE